MGRRLMRGPAGAGAGRGDLAVTAVTNDARVETTVTFTSI
jgi:hypothetical protein